MTYRFDQFILDADTRRLLRQDHEVHLSPKAFDLLHQLIENHTRAMSKSELHDKLWPATFVQEANLAGLVAEIRRALDDSAEEPRFIRTVPRFGYWFVGLEGSPASAAPSKVDGSAPSRVEGAVPIVRFWLVWEARQVALNEGRNVIGRAPDAAIWIDAPGVSRQHACIHIDGSSAVLEDLGSKNGTHLRGVRLTASEPLSDGDQIRLGSVVLTFRVPTSLVTETV